MFNSIKSFIITLIIIFLFIVSHSNAKDNISFENLYPGKWVNITNKSDIIEIQKLKNGFIFTFDNDSYLAYMENHVLFINIVAGIAGAPSLPCLIDNDNQLIWTDKSGTYNKYKKIK